MQLILNTDTDIGIQKMTTIKQDSLEEKFINNSLIEKVCSDITDNSNKCINNQDLIVQVYESIKTGEDIAQNINSETLIDETNNGNYKECNEVCDKELKEYNEISKLENEPSEEDCEIEDKKCMQCDENRDIKNMCVTLDVGNIMIQSNEIEMLEENKKQQDIMHADLKDKLEKPSETEAKIEEIIYKNFTINTQIEDIDILEEDKSQQEKIHTELKDKLEELSKMDTKIEEKIDEHIKNNTKIEDTIMLEENKNQEIFHMKSRNKLEEPTKMDNKIKEHFKNNTKIEEMEMLGGNKNQQEIIHTELIDKLAEPSEMYTKIEEKIDEHLKNNTKIEDTVMLEENKNQQEIIHTKSKDKLEEPTKMDNKIKEHFKNNTKIEEIERLEGNKNQQEIIHMELKDKLEEPSKMDAKIEEKIDEHLKNNNKIEDTKMLEENINQQISIFTESKDKLEEPSKMDSKIEEKIDEHFIINTKIEDGTEAQNKKDAEIEVDIAEQLQVEIRLDNNNREIATELEDKIKKELNTEIEDKIAGKNQVQPTEIQENLIEVQDEVAIEINNEVTTQNNCNLQDEIQDNDNNTTEDNIEKVCNVDTGDSIEGKDNNVKDFTEFGLCKKISELKDNIQEQIKDDKSQDKVQIDEEKCRPSMDVKDDSNNAKCNVIEVVRSNTTEQLENYAEIKETIEIQEVPASYETKDTNKQLDSIPTITNCDLSKTTGNENVNKAPPRLELHTELKNNNMKLLAVDEKMDLDLEKIPNLQNNDDVEEAISSHYNTKTTDLETGEVIDIADEKDEDFECIVDQDMSDIEKKSECYVNTKESGIIDKNSEHVLEIDIKEKSTAEISEDEKVDQTSLHKAIEKSSEKNVEEKKRLTHISRLSNTLDILSDEDEDFQNESCSKDIPNTVDKQCIHIEDDDDIMLIDEESNSKDSINKDENFIDPTKDLENEESKLDLKDKEEYSFNINEEEALEQGVETQGVKQTIVSKKEDDIRAQEEKQEQQNPLLPVNFLKTCKKNLADMTRDELEEFCILKIVESVVDRSNLSEVKSQLKSLGQNIEEYRKKASTLTKQNRDLQVVLKSIQEEQKKRSNLPITPLKITRSVGMQVLMTDKTSGIRKKPLQGLNTTQNNIATSAPRAGKGQGNQNSKLQKNQTINPPIPVPRLVPAANTSHLTNMKIAPNVSTQGKSNSVTGVVIQPVPNGIAVSPTPKPEKRSHAQMQQNNSVTVDLTDDEPPSKVIQRNITPPVRLVPPQNLLAAHRQPFGTNINSPRKVYIPISGSQNHAVGVRPGQTIMLKTISPQGPRQRCPAPAAKNNQSVNAVRMQRLPNRHPAPLPDPMKQYQPPNWKVLPPAPELKLSKVENGIVISWKIEEYREDEYEEIASYQLYAYQETSSPPSTALWKKIGDVKALPLPMACTLTQFMPGYKYYFAVRAVDVRSRLGPFSLPGSILLLNKI